MKTSWLNGSKRILSALLIAAALMFGWGWEGAAATDKGKKFAAQQCCLQRQGIQHLGKSYIPEQTSF